MANPNSISYESVKVLHFDPMNPRLPSSVDENSEEAIIRWMLEDATIIELMMSIGEKGYFPGSPLLVIPKNNSPDQYIVIDGNRRLIAVKLLLDPKFAPTRKISIEKASQEAKNKPISLPVIKFVDRDEIIYHVGYSHITGAKMWDAMTKAKYLKQLWNTLDHRESDIERYRILAKLIGSRADYVERVLTGLAVYEKIIDQGCFDISDAHKGRIEFSILLTALHYPSIYKHIGMKSDRDRKLETLNIDNLKELTYWLFEKHSDGTTRLGESRNLEKLNRVLDNQKALLSLRCNKSLSEALVLAKME